MAEKKRLQLRCCRKDFEELINGEQKERYLEVKQYWKTRVLKENGDYKEFDEIFIKNGYPADAPEIIFESTNNTGIISKQGKEYFKIQLGKILEIKNYNS